MMTTVNYAGFGLVALCLCSSGAMCADRLVGEVALTPASSACPGTMNAGSVSVNFVLPEQGSAAKAAAPVNRFRRSYLEAAAAAKSMAAP